MDSAYADSDATIQPEDKVAVATDADDVPLNAREVAGEHTDKGLVLDNLGKQTVQDADTVGRSVKGAHKGNHTRMGNAGDMGRMPGDTIKPEAGIVVGEETLNVRDCALNEHKTADRNLLTHPDTMTSLHVGMTLVDEDVWNIQRVARIVQKPQMTDARLVHIANAIALLAKLAKLTLEGANLDATKIQIAPML